jgi:hypothetical protein
MSAEFSIANTNLKNLRNLRIFNKYVSDLLPNGSNAITLLKYYAEFPEYHEQRMFICGLTGLYESEFLNFVKRLDDNPVDPFIRKILIKFNFNSKKIDADLNNNFKEIYNGGTGFLTYETIDNFIKIGKIRDSLITAGICFDHPDENSSFFKNYVTGELLEFSADLKRFRENPTSINKMNM